MPSKLHLYPSVHLHQWTRAQPLADFGGSGRPLQRLKRPSPTFGIPFYFCQRNNPFYHGCAHVSGHWTSFSHLGYTPSSLYCLQSDAACPASGCILQWHFSIEKKETVQQSYIVTTTSTSTYLVFCVLSEDDLFCEFSVTLL